MGKSEKQMDKEQGRNQRIIDTAFRLFVEKKIEAVSMDEVAKEAGVGRATLFRCYNNKTELAIAVCASKWKAYLDKLDEAGGTGEFPRISEFRQHKTSYDVCEGKRGQDLPHGYSGGTVHACDGAYHDGSVYPLRRWFYLGSNGQQGLYR